MINYNKSSLDEHNPIYNQGEQSNMNDLKKDLEDLSSTRAFKKAAEEARKFDDVFSQAAKAIHIPEFKMPDLARYEVQPIKIPTQEETNKYQSAAVFMRALADAALEWKDNLPDGYQPAILALLYGGIQIQVNTMAQVSFHGIRIEGSFDGSPCTILAHQSTIQILCYAQEITVEKPKNPIGFIWPDNKVEV